MFFWVASSFISLSGFQCAPKCLLLHPLADRNTEPHWESVVGLSQKAAWLMLKNVWSMAETKAVRYE